MSILSDEPLQFGVKYQRLLLAVVVLGAIVQFALGSFYLGVGHSPSPRHVPVGVVGPAAPAEAITQKLEADGSFDVTTSPSMAEMTDAIKKRDASGGFEITQNGVVAVTAGAGGTLPAGTLKTVASEINVANSAPQTVAVDVVPLVTDDINGASLGYILQVISLGASIASLGLGRLVPRVPQSLRRGLGHVAALVAYAAASALIVLGFSAMFGVGSSADQWHLFATYMLVSLAIAASTAGLVTLFGPVGSLSGGFYFLIGATISGASIPWNFLPTFWAKLGEWLPTGGGAELIRNTLYFPAADNTRALVCLGLFAGIGTAVLLIWNIIGNRGGTSAVDVDVFFPLTGEHHQHLHITSEGPEQRTAHPHNAPAPEAAPARSES